MQRLLLTVATIVATVAIVSAIPISNSGNGIPNNQGTASSGFTASAANCGQVEIDIFNLNAAGQAVQDLFQYITSNGGQGVNFAATTPYTLSLPSIITNGGVELEIILSSLQGSFSSPGSVSGPFNASIDTISVTLNGNSSATLTQNYSVAGNNFTFPTQFLGNGQGVAVNNFSVTITQIFPQQQGLPTNSTCTTQYILSVTNGVAIRGDPQFVGLRGQSYQVHGIDGAVYNIITDKTYQLNSRFAFLNGPRPCPLMPSNGEKSSACWAHPGSYLSELGLKVQIDESTTEEIFIAAGPAISGFAEVTVNGKTLKVGESHASYISFNTTHELTLTFGAWTVEVENSDMFVNLRSVRINTVEWSKLRSHGLLGQTWSNKRYPSSVRVIEGEVDDYMIAENSVFGSSFMYNLMQ